MDDRILRNKLEVVEYLQRRGFKIAKSKLYADAKKAYCGFRLTAPFMREMPRLMLGK
jgi:hypothetical protein